MDNSAGLEHFSLRAWRKLEALWEKFFFYLRKNLYGLLRTYRFAIATFGAAAVFAVLFVSNANAQCPGGGRSPTHWGARRCPIRLRC